MEADSAPRPWYWRPGLVVFVSSACIMILELVAGRIIAPQVGVSLYTWTSVIGVILAGMSLGNYLGGRLADRFASLRLLGTMFALGGVASLGVLGLDKVGVANLVEWPIIAEILLLIAVLFFIPATILGTISPIVTKLAMRDMASAGSTVGRVSASATLGSIIGTFATGFWLISWFGTHAVVWGVAVVLLLLGALFLLAGRGLAVLGSIAPIAILSVSVFQAGWVHNDCLRETNYFCIKVREEDRDGKPVRVLILDRLVHSYTSLESPTDLVYHYERTYAEITAYQAERNPTLRTFLIGGGGYTFPRYIEAAYPNAVIDVVEIDPGVTDVAREHLGLSRDSRIASYNEDARAHLSQQPTQTYDIIFGDAFNDFSVPYHLTTREFNELVRSWLADDGVYVVNIIDGALARFLRAYVRTLKLTFDHVYVVPNVSDWRSVSRDTFVIVAANRALDLSTFARDSRFVTGVMADEDVATLLAEGDPIVLTDRFAPVEQMLAPVFLNKTE